MYCQRCGAENAERSAFCSSCGQPLAAPAAPPPTDRAYLEIAIGPRNTDYYVSRFERFASAGSKVSWNWPAFFVTLPWLLYRKMWPHAVLYFFLPTVFLAVVALILGALFPDTAAAALAWPLELVLIFVVVPMFANWLYYRSVASRIARVKRLSGGTERQVRALASEGGTSPAALIVLLVLFVPMLGILAAIAIPAYQDYTIRAQVSEGLNLAAPVRAAVTETIQRAGLVPGDRVEAGLTPDAADSQGSYVQSVEVDDGRIDITYGVAANRALQGLVLSLTPMRPTTASPGVAAPGPRRRRSFWGRTSRAASPPTSRGMFRARAVPAQAFVEAAVVE